MSSTRPLWLLAAMSLVAGACASAPGIRPDPAAATTSTPAPTSTATSVVASAYGGTVVVAVGDGGSPRSLNPFLDGPDTAVLDLIGPAVFARGYDIDPITMELVPNVLASIPSVEDGTVEDLGDGTIAVTVGVAAGARWADGEPITGEDLAFTVRVATDPDLPIRADIARRYSGIETGSLVANARSLSFTMRASTDYEVLFDVIIPRHAVEGSAFAEAWNDTMWVGGGPFRFESWIPGQTLELVRNDNYWRTDEDDNPLPFLDRVIVRFYESGPVSDPRIAEGLAGGDVDLVTLGDGDWGGVGDIAGVQVLQAAGRSWEYLNFQFGPANRNESSLNRHLRFRRAVAAAIDRSALAAGMATAPLTSALAPYGPGYSATPWDRYPHDAAAARALIGQLGSDLDVDLSIGGGPPVVVTVPDDDPGAAAVAGQIVTMLREAGFQAQLQLEEPGIFYGPTTDNGSWDVSVGRFTAGPGVASAIAFIQIFDPAGLPFVGANFFRWGTIDSVVSGEEVARYAAIAETLRATSDPAEARRLIEEAERILADQVVIIPLIVSGRIGVAFRPGELAGPAINSAEGALWNVAQWTRQVSAPGTGS